MSNQRHELSDAQLVEFRGSPHYVVRCSCGYRSPHEPAKAQAIRKARIHKAHQERKRRG